LQLQRDFFFVELGMEPRVLGMVLGKYCTTELQLQPKEGILSL
jgi:hypothetical protein